MSELYAQRKNIEQIWKSLPFPLPNKVVLRMAQPTATEGQFIYSDLLVLRDDQSILTLMDTKGNVYYIDSSRCHSADDHYICIGTLYFAPGNPDTQLMQTVRKEILSILI